MELVREPLPSQMLSHWYTRPPPRVLVAQTWCGDDAYGYAGAQSAAQGLFEVDARAPYFESVCRGSLRGYLLEFKGYLFFDPSSFRDDFDLI